MSKIELHKAENPWRPRPLNRLEQQTHALDDKTEQFVKEIRTILYKLKPENCEQLAKQASDLLEESEEQFNCVIDLVFEKAIDVPNFSAFYATLSRCLALKKFSIGTKLKDYISFSKSLVIKCQSEFEKNVIEKITTLNSTCIIEKKTKKMKRRKCEDESKDAERIMKKRALGIIRFIGELFKVHRLTANIMHDCIEKLFNQGYDDSLQCLCTLLTIIGKDMDSDKSKSNNTEYTNKDKMNNYFRLLQEIVNERQTSARVRYMLKDMIDLRNNGWVSTAFRSNVIGEDGCIRSDSRNNINAYKPNFREDFRGNCTEAQCPFCLGQRCLNTESGWVYPCINCSGKGTRPIQKKWHWWLQKNVVHHTFSWQTRQWKASWPPCRCKEKTSTSQVSTGSIAGTSGPKINIPTARPKPVMKNPEQAVSTKFWGYSGRVQMKNKQENTATVLRGNPNFTKLEIEKKTKALLDRFLRLADFQETIFFISTFCASATISVFVKCALNFVLEQSAEDRQQIGQLMHDLIRSEVMSAEQFVKGLQAILTSAEKNAINNPRIWDYLGEIIVPLVKDKTLSVSFLLEVVEPYFETDCGFSFVSDVLRAVYTKQKNHEVKQVKLLAFPKNQNKKKLKIKLDSQHP